MRRVMCEDEGGYVDNFVLKMLSQKSKILIQVEFKHQNFCFDGESFSEHDQNLSNSYQPIFIKQNVKFKIILTKNKWKENDDHDAWW